MKPTIETINGRLCTVVWVGEIGKVESCCVAPFSDGFILYDDWDLKHFPQHIATALPALPRNPAHEDAETLYRAACLYSSEGLEVNGDDPRTLVAKVKSRINYEITHALYNGERVEIALKGSKMTDQKQELELTELIYRLNELQHDYPSHVLRHAIVALMGLAGMPESLRREAARLKEEDSWLFSVVKQGDLAAVVRSNKWGRAYEYLTHMYFDSLSEECRTDAEKTARYAAHFFSERLQTWLDENSPEPVSIKLELTLEPSEISPEKGTEND